MAKRKAIGDENFDNRLDSLKEIIVTYGGFFGGTEERTIIFDGERICVKRVGYNGFEPGLEELYEGETKSSLIGKLKELHIGKWKNEYDNPYVLDGTQWDVVLTFEDGSKVQTGGSNSFPRNFSRFLKVMEIE